MLVIQSTKPTSICSHPTYSRTKHEDIDALLWSFLPEEVLEEAVNASEGGAA
ncbi:hypothetical protein X734_10835 [Mesorhizobium sp. L2C084A000]|nr:hypothetical protein X734_10835 [Mesorhizobium sp. L2C084A000]